MRVSDPATTDPPFGGLPVFDVAIAPPDITPWLAGNIGLPGFTTITSGRPGPHVLVLAVMHGNEFAGAAVLDHLLRTGFSPSHGRLTLGFANLAAYSRFNAANPTASRFLDEDLNRCWDPALLDGTRHSVELDRARAMRPLIDQVDVVLDLHSMLWPADPLILCGPSAHGRDLACAIGIPSLVVADGGHAGGRRLIDYPRFTAPDIAATALLVEAGQHWQQDTIDMTLACVVSLLRGLGMAEGPAQVPAPAPVRFASVTHVVSATTSHFGFMRAFKGGAIIPARNTLIAMDGTQEIRTPYDNCLLVMPSLRPSRGHTAVRLARFQDE